MKDIVKRAIFGAIYVGLIVGAIFAGPSWFALLMLVFGIFAVIELRQACQPADYPAACFACDLIATGSLLSIMILSGFVSSMPERLTFALCLALAVVCFVMVVARVCLAVLIPAENAFRGLAVSAFTFLYVGASLLCTEMMINFDEHVPIVLSMFVMLWANDTGAYLVGCTFGRHRLCERLSPKKSWEGFWGGVGFALLAALVFALVVREGVQPWWWFVEALIVSLFGTIGDLLESMVKRSAGVKDSGHLIPGHGGILDRIDSLLLAGPVVFVALLLLFQVIIY